MKNNFLLNAFVFISSISFGQQIIDQNKIHSELTGIKSDSVVGLNNTYELSNLGYSIDLSLGYAILSDDLENNFNNFISYGMSFLIEYKNILDLGVGINYGASKTKEDIPIDGGFWNEGSRANFYRLELFLGHSVFDNKALRIKPIAGIASASIRAKEPNPYDFNFEDSILDEKVKFYKSSFLFGIILDVKTNSNKTNKSYNYGAIRFRYSYYSPHFEKKFDMFKGNIHSITIGFGGFSRNERKR